MDIHQSQTYAPEGSEGWVTDHLPLMEASIVLALIGATLIGLVIWTAISSAEERQMTRDGRKAKKAAKLKREKQETGQ